MAIHIHYTNTAIVIADESDPGRPPLMLPADSTSAEVGAAAAAYLNLPPEPNFDGFGLWLLTNADVAAAYDLAFEQNKITCGTLPSAVLAAAGGDTKHLRTTLLLLRRQNLLSDLVIAAMLTKAQECNLPADFLQALGGDTPGSGDP